MNQFYSQTFTLPGKKKKSVIFWMFLYLKVKLIHKKNPIHNPVSKTGDSEKSPVYLFQQDEKKPRLDNSVFGSLANTVCVIQQCPCSGVCGTPMAHKSLTVQIK